MTTPRLLRASSPVSPTPQRRPSPLPLSSPKGSPLIPSALRSPRSPSPLLLPKRVALPPSDIARQIAAVTQDLANLRAEEKRLLQASHTAPPQQFEAPQVNIIAAHDERTFQRILLIEEECIRLRAELAASTAREAALREMLAPNLAPVSVPTEKDVFGEDEDDSEPMDLATPLRPTVLLDPDSL
ncbi:hypothetical protein BC827DRAFT_1247093 [Russula dissimulans]|nr:hypothetical protein BC827DRAFT_1247093 [Russula dissimulans]